MMYWFKLSLTPTSSVLSIDTPIVECNKLEFGG